MKTKAGHTRSNFVACRNFQSIGIYGGDRQLVARNTYIDGFSISVNKSCYMKTSCVSVYVNGVAVKACVRLQRLLTSRYSLTPETLRMSCFV